MTKQKQIPFPDRVYITLESGGNGTTYAVAYLDGVQSVNGPGTRLGVYKLEETGVVRVVREFYRDPSLVG